MVPSSKHAARHSPGCQRRRCAESVNRAEIRCANAAHISPSDRGRPSRTRPCPHFWNAAVVCGGHLPGSGRATGCEPACPADTRRVSVFYTPLKRRTPMCTLVGAFPGAMPVLIGYVAAAGKLDSPAWLLYAILFLWQFPHFMAIAWMYREDYARAGYVVLPPGAE